jgi:hypothetical protein
MAELTYRHWHEALNPDECVSVDGNAPGRLNLSHWPGNRTPVKFRHDLSTGMCLKLADAPDRLSVLQGFTTVTNNHWDTDGACSAFALTQPGLALAHGHELMAAALVGDIGQVTTPEGLKIELTLTALTKRPDSPVASDKFGDDLKRRQAQYDYALEMMPRLLANPDLHADWFAREFWTIQQDLRALREAEAEVERFDALDLAVVTTDRPLHEVAVNTVTACDRVLTVQVGEQGLHRYALRLTTLSWFDLVSGPRRRRPDWSVLCTELNSEAGGKDGRWVAEDVGDPTPSLAFVNEAGEQAPNGTRPADVKRIVAKFFTQAPHLPVGI